MTEEESSENSSIVEVRDEQMVDPTSFNANPNPTRRTAHFLRPSLNPYTAPPPPHKIQSLSVSKRPNVILLCRSQPLEGWQTWVQELEAMHGPLWRKAGIFDAIKASTYHISRNSELLFRLAERWCPETNTFVFPWGEATLTLEDVFVLGGFSPLGESVLTASSSGGNVKQVKNKLIVSYRELVKIDRNVSHLRWKEHFMGRGNEIEHAGFLAVWLARHVFASRVSSVVTQLVFSMAASLSCGVKFDLASAILASIYRDLTLLKREILCSVSGHRRDGPTLRILSPLHFVGVWAWERFPSLGPVPRMISDGQTRLARWENHKRKPYNGIDDVNKILDSARDTFRWRPYAMSPENCPLPKFYVDSGRWVVVDSNQEYKIIVRFLMVCQLVGLNSVQRYNPNRVALQFGFDQDIPELIDRSKASCEPGWLEHEKNMNCLKLYIPHRLHEGDVTYRYSNWWKRLNPVARTLVGCKRKARSAKRMKKMSKSQAIVDFSSCHLMQGGSVIMKSGPCSDEGTSYTEEVEENKATENDPSIRACNDSHNEAVNGSEICRESKQSHGLNNFLCIQNSCDEATSPDRGQRHLNLVDEATQAGVVGVLIVPERGSEKCQYNAMGQDEEQGLAEHIVNMEEKSEYLEAGKSKNETSAECNGTLIGVVFDENALGHIHGENKPNEALHPNTQGGDTNYENNCDHNPFAALCLEYESRISGLEREISALLPANITLVEPLKDG